MPAKKTEMYVAVQTGFVNVDGQDLPIRAGETLVAAGHKLLKVAPDLFKPATDLIRYDVEDASATPAQKPGK